MTTTEKIIVAFVRNAYRGESYKNFYETFSSQVTLLIKSAQTEIASIVGESEMPIIKTFLKKIIEEEKNKALANVSKIFDEIIKDSELWGEENIKETILSAINGDKKFEEEKPEDAPKYPIIVFNKPTNTLAFLNDKDLILKLNTVRIHNPKSLVNQSGLGLKEMGLSEDEIERVFYGLEIIGLLPSKNPEKINRDRQILIQQAKINSGGNKDRPGDVKKTTDNGLSFLNHPELEIRLFEFGIKTKSQLAEQDPRYLNANGFGSHTRSRINKGLKLNGFKVLEEKNSSTRNVLKTDDDGLSFLNKPELEKILFDLGIRSKQDLAIQSSSTLRQMGVGAPYIKRINDGLKLNGFESLKKIQE